MMHLTLRLAANSLAFSTI